MVVHVGPLVETHGLVAGAGEVRVIGRIGTPKMLGDDPTSSEDVRSDVTIAELSNSLSRHPRGDPNLREAAAANGVLLLALPFQRAALLAVTLDGVPDHYSS